MMFIKPMRHRYFTLLEILIVVAIIAILAMIAIPNFLEAQVRSKVSRSMADMRTLVTAMEAYRLDNGVYPQDEGYPLPDELFPLTTPVAYITAVPPAAFVREWRYPPVSYDFYKYMQTLKPFPYIHYNWGVVSDPQAPYLFRGTGPDETYFPSDPSNGGLFALNTYDPTNGTVSPGDIIKWGGNAKGV